MIHVVVIAVACAQRASLDVISLLIEHHRPALIQRNRAGDTPLHLACERRGAPSLLRLLIESEPKALLIANSRGDTPLHVACRFESPIAVVETLIENGREALNVANLGGDLPLHVACAQRGTTQAVFQALVEAGSEAVVKANVDGNLPLHMACGAPTPAATVTKQQPNSSNSTAPLAVLELLTERWADSVHKPNLDGRLPLHVACATKHPSLPVVTFLLQRAPREIRAKDRNGMLPLHVACAHIHASLAVVQRLVHAWADGDTGMDQDDDGAGELEQATMVNERGGEGGMVNDRSNANNSLGGLKVTTPEGNTALHLACYYKAPLDVVQFLVHRWPQSVGVTNEKHDTPLQLVNNPHRGVPSQEVKAWLSAIPVVHENGMEGGNRRP